MDKLDFRIELMKELKSDRYNSYGLDNWDSDRFGVKMSPSKKILSAIKSFLLKRSFDIFGRNLVGQLDKVKIIRDTVDGLSWLWNLLEDDYSKTTLIKVIAYRILGYTKVKLPINTPEYWQKKNIVRGLIRTDETINVNFKNWFLNYFELSEIGVPINLYLTPNGVLTTFILKQYEYRQNRSSIKAQRGDYIIDAGGCWGNTALYFATEVGENGKVYTFEFVPGNLEVMKRNLHLNRKMKDRINIIQCPLWNKSNIIVFCYDNGPGSRVSNQRISENDFQTSTLSIDDFIRKYKVPKVDFIKMDIEGAELPALEGASETIKKYRPKLAISVYHSLNDFIDIPKFLVSLDLNYRFYLDHFTIHSEETVLFAIAE